MEQEKTFELTREKHLDHMVKVVPFIVFCYAVQCYFIMKIGPSSFSTTSLSILGGLLVCMIMAFITYDLKQKVCFHETSLKSEFFHFSQIISYQDIIDIEVVDPEESFSTLRIITKKKTFTYYFVDDAKKIQAWIDFKKSPNSEKMVA